MIPEFCFAEAGDVHVRLAVDPGVSSAKCFCGFLIDNFVDPFVTDEAFFDVDQGGGVVEFFPSGNCTDCSFRLDTDCKAFSPKFLPVFLCKPY